MSFCGLEEAFTGPPNPVAPPLKFKKSKQHRVKEKFTVPTPLPGVPGAGFGTSSNQSSGELLAGPPPAITPDDSAEGVKLEDMFPLPGATGDADEWQKAFTLEGSQMPMPDGSVSVAGKPTLWRQVAAPAVVPYQRSPAGNGWIAPPAPYQMPTGLSGSGSDTLAPVPTELSQRLDVLTRQLESLTTPTQLQGTAELFLFVAIGLLLLLAIDILLRFAVAAGSAVMESAAAGMRGGGRRIRYYGRIGKSKWF